MTGAAGGEPTWLLEMPMHGPYRDTLINSNQRRPWRHRQRVTKAWREETGWRARAAHVPRLERARIVVEFSFGDHRTRDVGNFSPTTKAITDGLVDAGLLSDDNDRHLVGPDLRRAEIPGRALIRVLVYDLAQVVA